MHRNTAKASKMATKNTTTPTPVTPTQTHGVSTASNPNHMGTCQWAWVQYQGAWVVGLVSPANTTGNKAHAHSKGNRAPRVAAFGGAAMGLVALIAHNPKKAGANCHHHYALAMPVLGAQGCTVATYTKAMLAATASGVTGTVPCGTEIKWHVTLGAWAWVPAQGSPAAGTAALWAKANKLGKAKARGAGMALLAVPAKVARKPKPKVAKVAAAA